MHTDRDDLDRLAERQAHARNRCPTCGDVIALTRIRCVTCPPRPLPPVYLDARARLRAASSSEARS